MAGWNCFKKNSIRFKCTSKTGWLRRGGCGFVFGSFQFHLDGDLVEGLLDHVGGFIGWLDEEALGLEQAVEAGRGQTEDTQDGECLGEVIGIATELDDAADVDAQELDFVEQAGEVGKLQVGKIVFAELFGIEAMFDGVEVAGRGASRFAGGGRAARGHSRLWRAVNGERLSVTGEQWQASTVRWMDRVQVCFYFSMVFGVCLFPLWGGPQGGAYMGVGIQRIPKIWGVERGKTLFHRVKRIF
jgi:hypothetical protein